MDIINTRKAELRKQITEKLNALETKLTSNEFVQKVSEQKRVLVDERFRGIVSDFRDSMVNPPKKVQTILKGLIPRFKASLEQ